MYDCMRVAANIALTSSFSVLHNHYLHCSSGHNLRERYLRTAPREIVEAGRQQHSAADAGHLRVRGDAPEVLSTIQDRRGGPWPDAGSDRDGAHLFRLPYTAYQESSTARQGIDL